MAAGPVTLLIMTATIAPKVGVPNLVRTDPRVRLQDYMHALGWYLHHLGSTFDHIVFAENSQSDLTPLRAVVADAGMLDLVEFLSFDGLDYPPIFDRGYGEMKLLDYTMEHSALIRASAAASRALTVWKVTGRYIIENIAGIVRSFPTNAALYCNCRDYPKRMTDMYLMGWTLQGYARYLHDRCDQVRMTPELLAAHTLPEELLRGVLDAIGQSPDVAWRFSVTPWIVGTPGGDHRSYTQHGRWKYVVRQAARTIAPMLWI